MPDDGSTPNESRTTGDKVRRAWGDMAREARCEIRSLGVYRGPTPELDRHVTGMRGVIGPTQFATMVRTMREGNVPEGIAEDVAVRYARKVVALEYMEQDAQQYEGPGAA